MVEKKKGEIMPSGVVKTSEEEKFWEKAKQIAESEGQKENWPFITHIFELQKHAHERLKKAGRSHKKRKT